MRHLLFSRLRVKLLFLVLVGIAPLVALLLHWVFDREGLSARRMVEIASIVGLALAATYVFAHVFILSRIEALVEATKKIAKGDLSARTGMEDEIGQLGSLIQSFDGMAEALEKRQEQLLEVQKRQAASLDQLRREENFIYTLLQNVSDIVVACDAEGKLIFLNQVSQVWDGFPPERLHVEAWTAQFELFASDGVTPLPTQQNPLLRAWNGERVRQEEILLAPKGKPPRYVLASAGRLDDENGNRIGAVAVMHDITERRKTDEAFRETHQRLKAVVEAAPVSISMVDSRGIVQMWNPAAERMFGWSEDEALGRPLPIVWPQREEAFRHQLGLAFQGQSATGVEICPRRKDGSAFHALLSTAPVRDARGEIIGVISIIADISERKEIERRLREGEELYRTLVETSPDAIVLTSLNGKVRLCNRQALKLAGYEKAEDVLDRNISDGIAAKDRPSVLEDLRAVLQGAPINNREYSIVKRDGTQLPVEMNASAVLDGGGEPKAFICVVRDVSERKRLEAQFMQAQKMEAVGRLAGGVAHDFNNLLSAIIGFSSLLLQDASHDGPLRRDLEVIKSAGERGAGLTRQLLAFSRKQVLQVKVVDLNAIVSETDKILRRLIGEDIELKMVLEPDLGRVNADPGQIEQIILNLAVNSRDAMPKGGRLTIETANVELDESYARSHVPILPGSYALLAVSDTGSGMDAEIQSHIFEPFFTTKEQGKGTGLGLATVYGIVKQSGGYIWVYSEPGLGTTFKIYLPRVDKAPEAVTSRAIPSAARRGNETVLVVEDDTSVRAVISHWFEKHGYSVLKAPDGQEALKLFERHSAPVQLLVTDLVMPRMGGLELAKTLGTIENSMKVLFLSGYSDHAVTHHGILEEGAVFLQKPFSLEALSAKVAELLDSAVQ